MMKRWIRGPQKPQPTLQADLNNFAVPQSLRRQIQELLIERPELGSLDVVEFIRDTLRRRIQHLENHNSERKKS